MTNTQKSPKTLEDDEILEGSVFTVKQTRYLKIIVIVMGLMLIFGFIALAIAIMNKAGKRSKNLNKPQSITSTVSNEVASLVGTPLKEIILPIGKDSKMVSYKLSGNRLILQNRNMISKTDQLIILDLLSGKTLSRITLPIQK